MKTIEEILQYLALANAEMIIRKDPVTDIKAPHFIQTKYSMIRPPIGQTRDRWAKLLLDHFDNDVMKVNAAIENAKKRG